MGTVTKQKMEIREIDGKKFIEFDEHKYRRKRMIISTIFLILLAAAIIAIANTTFTLIKNKEIIQKDPLVYGMDVHGFVSCQCYDEEGKDWYSEDVGFVHRETRQGTINYSQSINVTNFQEVFDGTGRDP